MAERAETVDEAAAEWIARRDSGDWSADDQAALDRWLAGSTQRRVAWLRLNAAWDAADAVRDEAAPARAPARRRRAYAAAAVAAGLVAAVFATVQFSPKSYATTVGGARTEVLEDGSRLELNTDSRLTVRQSDDVRRARLQRGEAYFTVAADPARPFVVEAGDYTVSSDQGAFSVFREGDRILVAVEKGSAVVRRRDLPAGAAEPIVCAAGSILEARPEATRLSTAPGRIERLLSWRRGLVTFDDARLAEVVAEFNRYNQTQLVVTDPRLAEARIGGAFRPTNVDAFVRILAQDLGVEPQRDGERILLAAGG